MKTNRTEHGRKANWQLKRRGKQTESAHTDESKVHRYTYRYLLILSEMECNLPGNTEKTKKCKKSSNLVVRKSIAGYFIYPCKRSFNVGNEKTLNFRML